MSNIVIHIGFPKTATTTLQSILRNHAACGYLGKGLRDSLEPSLSLDIARSVLFATSRQFDADCDGLAARIQDMSGKGACLVISDEAFTFAEHMFITQQFERSAVSDHDIVAERLFRLCGDAQVMMSVRAQPAFIKSMYRQQVKRDTLSEPFADYVDRELGALPHRSMLHTLRYDHAVMAYGERFGADNVHVELFEDTKTDFEGHLRRVARISGLDAGTLITEWGGAHENTDRPRKLTPGAKRLKRFTPTGLGKLIPAPLKARLKDRMTAPPVETNYTEDQSQTIHAYFAEPNKALARMTTLDLTGKGYPLP